MPSPAKDFTTLIDRLYDCAVEPEKWPGFLSRLGAVFHCPTVSFRVTDLTVPRVYDSWTSGFDTTVNQRYIRELAGADLFWDTLARAPLGEVQASHLVLDDREFERSEHYQQIFRPNGNFYAMGCHVERRDDRAVRIGLHRPRHSGPFDPAERRHLARFLPHLRRAARIMQRLDRLEHALSQARAALDRLPFALWMLDHRLHCRWMNSAASEALRQQVYGLRLQAQCLSLDDAGGGANLLGACREVLNAGSRVRYLRIDPDGACLLLVNCADSPLGERLGEGDGLLVFLLDPHRRVTIDPAGLIDLYGLTPAELRLVDLFLQGHDVRAASARLGITDNTGRTQLKSIMRKTGSVRQAELMGKLLLGTGSLECPRTHTEPATDSDH